jgi:hypothetical protein
MVKSGIVIKHPKDSGIIVKRFPNNNTRKEIFRANGHSRVEIHRSTGRVLSLKKPTRQSIRQVG